MKYRVWTKDFPNKVSCMTDWMTRAKCRRFILGRWGHWPPFAYISSAQTAESFRRANGE